MSSVLLWALGIKRIRAWDPLESLCAGFIPSCELTLLPLGEHDPGLGSGSKSARDGSAGSAHTDPGGCRGSAVGHISQGSWAELCPLLD